MKSLLIILPNDKLGGAEQFLKMIAEYFLNQSYDVDVYFLKKKMAGAWDRIRDDRLKLHYTKSKTEKSGAISVLWKLLSKGDNNYGYVFTSHIHLNSFINILRSLKIINCNFHVARESTSIYTRYTGNKLSLLKFYHRFCYNNIDLLICQTQFMRQQLREGAPHLFKKLKVVVLANPINPSVLKRKNNEIISYSNFIVSAGRLIIEKGYDILIDAFHKLHDDYPKLKLVILGEGSLRQQLENQILKYGLQDYVDLPGFVENVYPYFKQAELCVVSSRIEGFPNVLLQMMSQNEKVVSTLCAGGIDELKGVEVCPTESSIELYEAMSRSIRSNASENRYLFDKELERRSIDNFVAEIKHYLMPI